VEFFKRKAGRSEGRGKASFWRSGKITKKSREERLTPKGKKKNDIFFPLTFRGYVSGLENGRLRLELDGSFPLFSFSFSLPRLS